MSETTVTQPADIPADSKEKKTKSRQVGWKRRANQKKHKKNKMNHEEPHQNGVVENTMAGERLAIPGISHRRGIRWVSSSTEDSTASISDSLVRADARRLRGAYLHHCPHRLDSPFR